MAARTRGARAGAGDDNDFPRPSERKQLAHRVRGARHVVRFGGESGEAADRFAANVLIGIRPRDVGEHADVVDPRDRGAADARIGVLPRERAQCVAFVRPELIDSCRTHGGIRVLPARSWTELFENAHSLLTVA